MVITVGSTKGGAGKSTIACNLAVCAANTGKRVMLIDSDVQGSAMAWRALRDKDDITSAAILTPTIHKDINGFNAFDLILIDAGGRDSAVFRSAIMAADRLLIPCLPTPYDIWAASDTVEILKDAATYKDIDAAFILNQLIPNTLIAREAIDAIEEMGDLTRTLDTKLYRRVAYQASIVSGQGVIEYEPGGKAAQEMAALWEELNSSVIDH